MRPGRPISANALRGQPGLSRAACDRLVAEQPMTVLKALGIRGVGRKTTKRLLALGLLTDPEGVQTRARTTEELKGPQGSYLACHDESRPGEMAGRKRSRKAPDCS